MYVTHQQSQDLIEELFGSIHNEYSEKLTFLSNLIEGDDWSFVIKSHALLESLITELIILKISETELKKLVQRLPLHGEAVSKIAILKLYELLSAEEIKFLNKFSEIRNNIVHNYENLSFSFENYASSLDNNQHKNWKQMLRLKTIETNKMDKLIAKQPMIAVWFNVLLLINSILHQTYNLKANQRITEEAQKTSNELLQSLMNNA